MEHSSLFTIQPRKIEQRTLDCSLEKIVGGQVRTMGVMAVYSSWHNWVSAHFLGYLLQKVKITTRCAEIDREVGPPCYCSV